jgi:hypothetical protein
MAPIWHAHLERLAPAVGASDENRQPDRFETLKALYTERFAPPKAA